MKKKSGFVSFGNLDKRLEAARKSPDKLDTTAFNIYQDARNPNRFVVAMYAYTTEKMKDNMASVEDSMATGYLGERYACLTLREVVDDFGRNGEDAMGIFRNVNAFLNGPLDGTLKKLGL